MPSDHGQILVGLRSKFDRFLIINGNGVDCGRNLVAVRSDSEFDRIVVGIDSTEVEGAMDTVSMHGMRIYILLLFTEI